MKVPVFCPRHDKVQRKAGRLPCVMAMLLIPGVVLSDQPPQVHAIESHLDRDFGYVMGETLRQTVRVETDAGYQLEAEMLPQAGGAINDWLEIRDAQWDSEQYPDKAVYHIVLTYQVFKGVRDSETLGVPALPLRFRHGDEVLQTDAPPLPFTLNPLIPAKTPDEAVSVRGSHPPSMIPDAGHVFGLVLALAALAAALLHGAWRLGFPPFRSRRARPFERALRELRKLRRQPPSPETYRAALRSFHGALNECARRAVVEGQLARLLREHPEFVAVSDELEAFFVASHRMFFSSPGLDPFPDYPLSRLENLCLRCRAIERRRS